MPDTIERITPLIYTSNTEIQQKIRSAIHTDKFEPMFIQSPSNMLEQLSRGSHFVQPVIIDLITQPRTDAYQLCKTLKSGKIGDTPTLVALVNAEDDDAISQALSAGFDDCITLPLHPALLEHRLTCLIQNARTTAIKRRYSSLLQYMPEAMIITTPDDRILEWNQAAERLYGWTAEEADQQSLRTLLATQYSDDKTHDFILNRLRQQFFSQDDVLQQHRSGESIHSKTSMIAVRDEHGTIIEHMIISQDITSRKEVEKNLHDSRLQMQSILDAMTEVVIVFDRLGKHVWIATDKNADLIRPADELVGRTWHDVVEYSKAADFVSRIQQTLQTGNVNRFEYNLEVDGITHWYTAVISPLDDNRVVWVAHDITERKTMELALQESSSSYQQLFEAANDAIILIDVESGQIVEANPQAGRQLGYIDGELIGLPISEIEVSIDANRNDTLTATMSSTSRLIFEQNYRHRDGTIIPVESSSRIITYRGRTTILSFSRDISARKQARRAERQQRLLAETLRDTAAAFNSTMSLAEVLELILEYINRLIPSEASDVMLIDENGLASIRQHRGYQEAGFEPEILKATVFDVASTPNLQDMYARHRPLYISDTRSDEYTWVESSTADWIRSYMGAPIVINEEVAGFINLVSTQPAYFDEQYIDRLQAFANQSAIAIQNARLFQRTQNHAIEMEQRVEERTAALSEANQALKEQIIERRQIEEALEEERNLLRTLIDNLPDHIYVKDLDSRFILGNKSLIDFLGLKGLDDLLLKTDQELQTSIGESLTFEAEQLLMTSGQPLVNNESQVVVAQGEVHWFLSTKLPLRDARGQIVGLVGINRDITDLKLVEEQLQEERNLLRALIDTIPDLIYIKDRQSQFVLVNRAMASALGADRIEDVAGTTERDFLPDEQAEAMLAREQRVLTTQQPIINHNTTFMDASGTQHWHLTTNLLLRDSMGSVTGIIGVNRNISELKQAEAQLEQVLTSARCLLWYAIVDEKNGTYTWSLHIANEEAAQKFLPMDLGGQRYTEAWLESILPDDRDRRRYVFRSQINRGQYDYSLELRCRQADGALRWLTEDVQIRQLTPGRWRLVGVCTDITERKKALQELQKAKDELEERIQERTHALVQANTVLKQEITERKRAEEAERSQRILAEALRDSSAAINNNLDMRSVLNHILDSMTRVIRYDAASIYLTGSDPAHESRVIQQRGHDDISLRTEAHIIQMPEVQAVVTTGEASIITDMAKLPPRDGQERDFAWIRSSITLPVRLDEEIIGILNLDSARPDYFTTQHASWLQGFASQISIAIRNERLMNEIRRHAAELEERVQERTAELENERAQLQAILDAMRDGVVYQDLNDEPQYINRAMSHITGYTQEEWLNHAAEIALYATLDSEQQIQYARKLQRALEFQGFWEGDMELQRSDGTTFDASIICTSVRSKDESLIGNVTVIRDISQAKELEAQKTRFIASASHELRTPITNMKTRLYLMKRQPEKFHEHIEIAESVVNWMRNLVENMFDLSRFERGVIELDREKISIQDLVRTVIGYQTPEAREHTIQLTSRMPADSIFLYADRSRLTQVLTNLVSNAVHYTPAGGNVTVEITQPQDDEIMIQVIDDGEGIAEEDLKHLFQPFFRARTDNQGAGLGLSISHDIVKLHNGTITVESKLQEGSNFIVRLPTGLQEN